MVAENGPSVLGDLATVLLVAYAAYILHMVVVYSLTVKAMGGLSPIQFFKGMLPAILFAFSSASSVGTLPLNLECVQKLGAKKDVASFVLPLGATINMDGTAILSGACASFFIATCFGVDLTNWTAADNHFDGNTGIHRDSRRAWGRDDYAGNGAAERWPARRGDCACGRDRPYF